MMQAVFNSSIKILDKSFTWVAMVDGWYLLALQLLSVNVLDLSEALAGGLLPILSNIKGPV